MSDDARKRVEATIRVAQKLLDDAQIALQRLEYEVAACWTAGALAALNQILDRHPSTSEEIER